MWTDGRVEILKNLYADGLSGSEIAAELGGTSRNAVISKIHRLGVPLRGNRPPSAELLARRAESKKPKRIRLITAPERKSPTNPPRHTGISTPGWMPEEVPFAIPVGQRCTLLELTEKNCHWPVGDPRSKDFFFCGGDAVTGLPYCAYHSRVAYRPSNYGQTPSPSIAPGEAA